MSRILCVDESPLSYFGIRKVLTSAGFAWHGAVSSIAHLVEQLKLEPVEILVSEMRINDLDILEALPSIQEASPETKVILYSYVDNPTYVARASACGVWDFVLKTHPASRLIESCHSVERGVRSPNSLITTAKSYLLTKHPIQTQSFDVLTKREQQILVHLSLGLSNREISQSLDISLETVKEHVQNVLRKISVNDRTAAAVWAIRNGLPPLSLEPPIGLTANPSRVNHAFVQASSA